ncbi:serine hydrolase [Variovorax sp. J31P207]|nr:serine hydrolase [Variovorax sp. J31P207]MDM0067026.1 serine hydrolase [Variovorax sp. J31P207]
MDHRIGCQIAGGSYGNLVDLADLAGNQIELSDYQQGVSPGRRQGNAARLDAAGARSLLVRAVKPAFLPGEQYQLSNTNVVLVSMEIEALTGQLLGDVLAARIFGPLGLTGMSCRSSATLPPPTPTRSRYEPRVYLQRSLVLSRSFTRCCRCAPVYRLIS